MNAASEAILRWYLEAKEIPGDEASELIGALKRGLAKNEKDAHAATVKLLTDAGQAAKGTPHEEEIWNLLSIHNDLVAIDELDKKIDALISIQSILEKPASNVLAGCIQNWKIKSLLERI